MLDASHALVGASLAKLIPNPYLGYPLALISHIILDYIPHWDMNTRRRQRTKLHIIAISLTDAVIGFSLGYFIFKTTVPNFYLLTMMFIAQLPDWLEAPYHVFDWRFFPFSQVKAFQSKHHRKLDLPWGLVTQILVIGLIVSLAL